MSAHPLAVLLIENLRPGPGRRVLDFACGRGRNAAALRAAGFEVIAIDEVAAASERPFAGVAGRFAAAISTHGLLHGTPAAIGERVRGIAALLEPGGTLYATFGSVRDARHEQGERLGEFTYAPVDGEERGVPHTFFDRERLRALLEERFTVDSLEEHGVDQVVGSWGHTARPLSGAVHWFAIATVG
ncbi:MAG TPA: methyltransferase domain-containing protein [Candidatus Cybelea sp.]|nr:methyltransferase domain-containing protein [Candidatus Cybelea sp.]